MPKHKLEMRFTYLIDTDDMRSVLEKMEFPSFDLDDSSQEFLDSSYSWEEIEVIGYQTGDGMICLECGKDSNDTEAAEAEGYPDGFTCAECGKVVI